ncbi:MAG: hypothetical protein UX36_C0006G0002 [Microgenomates group bacterium GW2011_GWC1_46_15]|nr:MAG: hypothetical protein UX36_C0006G0002 [Microgenomates group bacterium GW2011_GWC1_46_15]
MITVKPYAQVNDYKGKKSINVKFTLPELLMLTDMFKHQGADVMYVSIPTEANGTLPTWTASDGKVINGTSAFCNFIKYKKEVK